MSNESKFSELSLKLTRATSAKEIKWRPAKAPAQLAAGTDSMVFDYFVTKYNGIGIAIYEVRYQTLDEDLGNIFWKNIIELAVLTEEGFVAQTFSDTGFNYSLRNLHELAKSSAYNVEEMLDQALKK